MGLLFVDKIISLLELHPPQNSISRDQVFERVEAEPMEGFFKRDGATNKTQVVSRDAITVALRDARWWGLVELEPLKSRLTDAAKELKTGKSIARDKLDNVLADVLHTYTAAWAGEDKALDVESFVELVQSVAKSAVPSSYYLWTHISKSSPKIFNDKNLKPRRFRQLLALLGTRGSGRLQEVRTQLHFVTLDPRLDDVRPPER